MCWLITAGRLYGRHQKNNTTDKRRQNKLLMLHSFLGMILYIGKNSLFEMKIAVVKIGYSFLTTK